METSAEIDTGKEKIKSKRNARRRGRKDKKSRAIFDDIVNHLVSAINSNPSSPSTSNAPDLCKLTENLDINTIQNEKMLKVNCKKTSKTRGELQQCIQTPRKMVETSYFSGNSLEERLRKNCVPNPWEVPTGTGLKYLMSSDSPVVWSDLENNSKFINNTSTQQKIPSQKNREILTVSEVEQKLKNGHKKKSRTKNKNIKESFPKYFDNELLKALEESNLLIKGTIRINPKNFKECYVNPPDEGMDILIEGIRDRNRALEGDDVYIVLNPKENFRRTLDSKDLQRTGHVVSIVSKNHNRTAVGVLKRPSDNDHHCPILVPRDSRLPRIRIQLDECPEGFLDNPENFEHILYLAEITEWNDTGFADGRIIRKIGTIGEIESETQAILAENDIEPSSYLKTFSNFYPSQPFQIPPEEYSSREDLTKDCVFSIDPESARDLDDAVSYKVLPNGNYEVGVHISDVTYFLKEGTPLDEEVSKRATTVYLVQSVYHMLPRDLCTMCSLTPGEDKLTVSVFWEFTPDFHIISHRFTRSIINSCVQLTYDHAQKMLTEDVGETDIPTVHGNHPVSKLVETVRGLNKIAMHLRRGRYNNGALSIHQIKINFKLNLESGLPSEYYTYVNKPAHRLIEELMLLANITVADKIYHDYPDIAFLRSHPPPIAYMMTRLQKNFEKYGIILNIDSSGAIQESLSRNTGESEEMLARSLVLNNALAKPMTRAKYFCSSLYENDEDRSHYALSVPLYSHFTSPIRRYPDVMVHRLLCASLGYRDKPKYTVHEVASIAANCNKQKYTAKKAGEQSSDLFLSIYIGQVGCIIVDAVVCEVRDKSFDCIGITTGSHHRIYLDSIKAVVKKLDPSDKQSAFLIQWPPNQIQVIDMFSIVKLTLMKGTKKDLRIDAKLVRPRE